MTPKTNRKLTLGFAALLCGILLPSALRASGKLQTVTRPISMKAHSQMVLNLANGSYNSKAEIISSHCGKSVGLGWGLFGGAGAGKIIAANGDEIFFDSPTTVLQGIITGGTGSFGKKFTKIALGEKQPKKIIIFSRDELKQHEMRQVGYTHPNLRYFIGDVRDQQRMRRAHAELRREVEPLAPHVGLDGRVDQLHLAPLPAAEAPEEHHRRAGEGQRDKQSDMNSQARNGFHGAWRLVFDVGASATSW